MSECGEGGDCFQTERALQSSLCLLQARKYPAGSRRASLLASTAEFVTSPSEFAALSRGFSLALGLKTSCGS